MLGISALVWVPYGLLCVVRRSFERPALLTLASYALLGLGFELASAAAAGWLVLRGAPAGSRA